MQPNPNMNYLQKIQRQWKLYFKEKYTTVFMMIIRILKSNLIVFKT